MEQREWLAEKFEENRGHLRGVAYRMLGSAGEADDAVQEAWLRLSRSGAEGVENLRAWLTTVVARISMDMLRSRASRREDALEEEHAQEPPLKAAHTSSPEDEAVLADSVGLALMVVLERLAPAERLAFVLHDMFDLSFDEIASILDRSPAAARQLASRARRRVRGSEPTEPQIAGQRRVVDAFLAALRAGDLEGLVAVLHPDVVVRADQTLVLPGAMREARGARVWAQQAIKSAQGARAGRVALINGAVGLVVAPKGKLFRVLEFRIEDGRIAEVNVIGDPARLGELDLAILDE